MAKKTKKHWTDYLRAMFACDSAVAYCRKFDSPREAFKAVQKHPNGLYWLTWLYSMLCDDDAAMFSREAVVFGRRPCVCGNPDCRLGVRKTPTMAELVAAYPTPTVADLKSAARGKAPWVVLKGKRP